MKKPTQEEIVKMRLTRYGSISNLWAITHNIWRLGAVICDLRKKGMNITGSYLLKEGKLTKVFNYTLNK
jgi:hypothetical protein